MAQGIEHPVSAPFSLSKVLLSFLQFSVQFLNIFQKFREVFVDKKLGNRNLKVKGYLACRCL